MTIPSIALNDSTSIPQFGFGVFQVAPEETEAVTLAAFEAGYRHIDTAQMYGNEEGVGKAIAASGLSRDELYITTKVNNNNHRPDDVRTSVARSVELLGQIDLMLIHWPLPTQYDGDFESTWATLIEQRDAGLITSIGVSNFQPAHLTRVIEASGVIPVVNQVEAHPYFSNDEVRTANQKHGIATEAWSPIAQGAVLNDPVIVGIAERLSASPSQVTLAWHLQQGNIVFPKTVNPERMRENLAAVELTLTADDVAAISALNKGEEGRRGPNPDVFDYIPA